MQSDFGGARKFLERAFDCLKGTDKTSETMREVIATLIEAALTEEHERRRPMATVLPFRARPSSSA